MTDQRKPRLDGKIVFITAAAQGIAGCAAEYMAREGATVIAADLQGDKVKALAERIGGVGIEMDGTSEEAWRAASDFVMQRFGKLDALVNAIGWADQKPVWDCDVATYRRHLQINAETAFLGCRACLDLLERGAAAKGGHAAIVNIASIAGVTGIPAAVPYSTSKAALIAMTKGLAFEFAHYGKKVRANAILPGTIDTVILKKWFDERVALGLFGGLDEAQSWTAMAEASLIGTLGQVADIANAIVYLVSDESRYVNAATLKVDGGLLL